MSKIAFLLEGNILSEKEIDIQKLLLGNPGIGGTEYLFLLLTYMLSYRNNGLDVILLTESTPLCPLYGIKTQFVDDFYDAVQFADQHHFDYLVYRSQELITPKRKAAYGQVCHGLKLIMWCHNFLRPCDLDFYVKADCIKALVCVGKEQMDVLCDHPLYRKMTYIYNCVDQTCVIQHRDSFVPFAQRKHIVTYIGSLVPMKSFHVLAYAWPKVIERIPDAELHVIGSSGLYQSGVKLGKLGLAKWDYEDYFLHPLTIDGELLPNVYFHGLMGEEKNDILAQTKVGVPNPLGTGETFCLSAVEMQLMGAKVAAMECCGYMDTVFDGVLCKRRDQLADSIIEALLSDSFDYEGALAYFKQNFSQTLFVEKWETLFKGGFPSTDGMDRHPDFRHKKLKRLLMIIKTRIPLLGFIPALEVIKNYFDQNVLRRFYFRIPSRKFDQIDWIN